MNPSTKKCVVLVPANGSIEPECEQGLRVLESRGYQVRRVPGFAAIDLARSQMATDALRDGFDELLWIDSDIAFNADDVEKLRGHGATMIAGLYPKKGTRALASHLLPGTRKIVFGEGGGILPILYPATGFLLTKRSVYEAIQTKLELPVCNTQFERPLVPYFMPTIVTAGEHKWYLSEDFAFAERARRAGHPALADTTIHLRHIGRYAYSWEDAGGSLSRHSSYTFHVA
ncbi:MAG: hypothetical protein IPK82_15720 [Polyangiaceae bacterium]|nr:hypothetical protein [Polyangiaceae bacterium]